MLAADSLTAICGHVAMPCRKFRHDAGNGRRLSGRSLAARAFLSAALQRSGTPQMGARGRMICRVFGHG